MNVTPCKKELLPIWLNELSFESPAAVQMADKGEATLQQLP